MGVRAMRKKSPGFARCGKCGDWITIEEWNNVNEKRQAMDPAIREMIVYPMVCEDCLIAMDPVDRLPT